MRLIDADKAEGYFYEHLDDLHVAVAMNALNEMPAIKVEPVKHGKWLEYPALWKCNQCGRWVFKGETRYFNYEFCPHCGAKMDNQKGKNHENPQTETGTESTQSAHSCKPA